MSHYDKHQGTKTYFAQHPSMSIFLCAASLSFIAMFAPTPFTLITLLFVAGGIFTNLYEHVQDARILAYWQGLANGLADQLRDRQDEAGYYQHANAVIEMMETLPGGRVYHGPITAADIYEPLLTNGEEA